MMHSKSLSHSVFILVGIASLLVLMLKWLILPAFSQVEAETETSITKTVSASFTYTDGDVKKRLTGAVKWLTAGQDTTVIEGDKVRTMREARAELKFFNEDIVRLAPKTTIDIEKLFIEQNTRGADVNVDEGEVWMNIAALTEEADYTVGSLSAETVIRGTILRMGIDDEEMTHIKVYQGKVEVSPIEPEDSGDNKKDDNKTGVPSFWENMANDGGPKEVEGPKEVSFEDWIRVIEKLQQITVTKEGKIYSWGNFSKDDEDEQTDWVKWNKVRDRELKR